MARTYTWKDIVKIDDFVSAEEFPISGEKNDDSTYRLDEFILAVADKYGVEPNAIETYMLDDISFNPLVLPFGKDACGCYIDGEPEWTLHYYIETNNYIDEIDYDVDTEQLSFQQAIENAKKLIQLSQLSFCTLAIMHSFREDVEGWVHYNNAFDVEPVWRECVN